MKKLAFYIFSTGLLSSPTSLYAQGALQMEGPSLGLMLLFGFIGGIILNVMPCVLPILSIKIFSMFKHAGSNTRQVRLSSLATILGILGSFVLLALCIIIIKALGHTIGWGFQFQEPVFVSFLALVMVLLTSNLWGLYEFKLPAFLSKIHSFQQVDVEHHRYSLLEGVFHGFLITLMATPCSAPFLGTALSFGLAQPPLIILLIFVSIALGMSLPYLLLLLNPKWLGWLPKPGKWMGYVKAGLGFLLLATTFWLMLVLSMQITSTGLFLLGTSYFSIMLLFLLRRTTQKVVIQKLFIALIVLICFFSLGLTHQTRLNGVAPVVDKSAIKEVVSWHPFSQTFVDQSIQLGKIVFVDVTADWCVTCKVNEKLVLNTPEFSKLVMESNIVLVKADWTNPNKPVTRFLETYQRYAIPFYILFGPAKPEGVILPEVITLDAIRKALDKVQF